MLGLCDYSNLFRFDKNNTPPIITKIPLINFPIKGIKKRTLATINIIGGDLCTFSNALYFFKDNTPITNKRITTVILIIAIPTSNGACLYAINSTVCTLASVEGELLEAEVILCHRARLVTLVNPPPIIPISPEYPVKVLVSMKSTQLLSLM